MRRFAASGLRVDLLHAARLFRSVPDKPAGATLLKGFEEGMRGRTLSGIPTELAEALEQIGGGSLALRVRRRDQAAVRESLQLISNDNAKAEQRSELILILGEIGEMQAIDAMAAVLRSDNSQQVRVAAASSLGRFTDSKIAELLIELHNDLPAEVRLAAQSTLASRREWALSTLAAVERKQIDQALIPPIVLRKMLLHDDSAIASQIAAIYGDALFDQASQQQQVIERLGSLLESTSGNPYAGKQLYGESCGKCHMLFGVGGRVGPDLTTFQRDDVHRLLTNIVRPSLEIREGFETYVVQTDDGRLLSGFIADADPQVVILRGVDGQAVTLARDSIEEMQMTKQSVMPEGLLKDLSDEQIRDLFAYLRSSQPLP